MPKILTARPVFYNKYFKDKTNPSFFLLLHCLLALLQYLTFYAMQVSPDKCFITLRDAPYLFYITDSKHCCNHLFELLHLSLTKRLVMFVLPICTCQSIHPLVFTKIFVDIIIIQLRGVYQFQEKSFENLPCRVQSGFTNSN